MSDMEVRRKVKDGASQRNVLPQSLLSCDKSFAPSRDSTAGTTSGQ